MEKRCLFCSDTLSYLLPIQNCSLLQIINIHTLQPTPSSVTFCNPLAKLLCAMWVFFPQYWSFFLTYTKDGNLEGISNSKYLFPTFLFLILLHITAFSPLPSFSQLQNLCVHLLPLLILTKKKEKMKHTPISYRESISVISTFDFKEMFSWTCFLNYYFSKPAPCNTEQYAKYQG